MMESEFITIHDDPETSALYDLTQRQFPYLGGSLVEAQDLDIQLGILGDD